MHINESEKVFLHQRSENISIKTVKRDGIATAIFSGEQRQGICKFSLAALCWLCEEVASV